MAAFDSVVVDEEDDEAWRKGDGGSPPSFRAIFLATVRSTTRQDIQLTCAVISVSSPLIPLPSSYLPPSQRTRLSPILLTLSSVMLGMRGSLHATHPVKGDLERNPVVEQSPSVVSILPGRQTRTVKATGIKPSPWAEACYHRCRMRPPGGIK